MTDPLNALLEPLIAAAAAAGRCVRYAEAGEFFQGAERCFLPRLSLTGRAGGGDAVRLGIFAAIHGDEPEGAIALRDFALELIGRPEVAEGYELELYPVCNPTGFRDGTRHSRAGLDLNREFWRGSGEPEVALLERELGSMRFHGLVSLHSDDTASGLYCYVRGATLTEALAQPALLAAGAHLPVAHDDVIDGFPAASGIIRERCYEGVLSDAGKLHPPPFEIIFETPGRAPRDRQVAATIAALRSILVEYRQMLAFGGDL